ncbi:MAG: sulfotransferase [Chloroflexi bacterium]|nr:sulfotransferase [Chloroflexota bacterium]
MRNLEGGMQALSSTGVDDVESADSNLPFFFHIGWMRTGSTYLQDLMGCHSEVHLVCKSRFFSHDPSFHRGRDAFYRDVIGDPASNARCIVDSDENYAMGRFKRELIRSENANFNFKAELQVIYHDIDEMVRRMSLTVPHARIIGVVRKQDDWLSSVYKHDVLHFGLYTSFARFIRSELGQAYLKAADYARVFERYVGAFGPDRVQFLLYEDLQRCPDWFFEQISGFLGVELTSKTDQSLRRNVSASYVAIALLRRANRLSETALHRPERTAYVLLRSWCMRIARRVDRIPKLSGSINVSSSTERQEILDRYRIANRSLGKLLNRERDMADYGYF